MKRVSDLLAFLTDDYVRKDVFASYSEASDRTKGEKPCDIAILEVSDSNEVDLSKAYRKKYEQCNMMLIVNQQISPMEYLVPEIRAASLIVRPTPKQKAEEMIKGFLRFSFRDNYTNENGKIMIENKGTKTAIPFSQIYYLEVRGKKIYIRLRYKEYCINRSLESIKEELPDYFVQSHRSFIVNTRLLESIKLSENIVSLYDGIIVPLSRSFKQNFKELVNNARAV